MPPLRPSSYVTAVVTLLLLFAIPATTVAAGDSDDTEDRPTYEPTAEQLELNERGVEALITGEHARSVALLTEAYRLGEVNILALNLGRAYQALGECEEAEAKLELVDELPVVDTPPPQRVEDQADEYLLEVRDSCEEDVETDVETDADDAEDLEIEATDPSADDDRSTEDLIALEDDDWLTDNQRDVGRYTAGAGTVLAATAAGLHLTARHQRSTAEEQLRDEQYRSGDDADVHSRLTQAEVAATETRTSRLDTAAVTAGAVGLLAIGAGAYLWMSAPDVTGETTALDVSVGSDRWLLRWSTAF